MKEGASSSVIRSRSQATQAAAGKSRGGERCGNAGTRFRQARSREASACEPLQKPIIVHVRFIGSSAIRPIHKLRPDMEMPFPVHLSRRVSLTSTCAPGPNASLAKARVSTRGIGAPAGAWRCFGWQPPAKVSMMIMRPPQKRHGRGSTRGSSAAAVWDVSACFEREGTASNCGDAVGVARQVCPLPVIGPRLPWIWRLSGWGDDANEAYRHRRARARRRRHRPIRLTAKSKGASAQ